MNNNRVPNNQRQVSDRIERFIRNNNIQNLEVCFDDGAVIFSSSLSFEEANNIIVNQIIPNVSIPNRIGDGVQESSGLWLNASDESDEVSNWN